jgi:predicted phage tail protein
MKRALLLALIFAAGCFAQTDSITLTWTAPTTGGVVQNYEIFRSLTSTVSTTTVYASVAAPTTTYTDTAVTEGTTYWYEIEACNGSGSTLQCSAPTAAVSATVPFQVPGTPGNVTITAK